MSFKLYPARLRWTVALSMLFLGPSGLQAEPTKVAGAATEPAPVPVEGSAKLESQSQPTKVTEPSVQEDSTKLPSDEKVQMGISVSKPGSAVYAQLPKLPRGSGFILQSVDVGGTADVAGLKPMDVIWKMDGQLLINENQLMTLLSLHRPGDRVTMNYFHAGLEKKAVLVLQGRKASAPVPPKGSVVMIPPFPGAPADVHLPALPMRVISYEDRSASISDKNGTATLIFREGKPWLHIESAQGVEAYNGPVTKAEDVARVPIAWRGRLPILQRSLEESIRLRRLPRIRRVPTPKQRVVGGE